MYLLPNTAHTYEHESTALAVTKARVRSAGAAVLLLYGWAVVAVGTLAVLNPEASVGLCRPAT